MMTNRIGGLTTGNAAYNYMNAANSLMSLPSFHGNTASLLNAEKGLSYSMINNNLMYKAGILQEQTNKKLEAENIKRTFSVFA